MYYIDRMLLVSVVVLISCLSLVQSRPRDLITDDTQVVGSELSKVYAVAPFEDLAPAASGHDYAKKNDDDEVGFYISKSTKGDDGYKHFDSYHKKGGDKYGYESHSAYGKADGGESGGSHQEGGKYQSEEGDEDVQTYGEHEEGEGEETENKPQKYQKYKKQKKGKGPATAATEGESYYYETGDGYNSDEHDDSGHYFDGEGDSEGYDGYDGAEFDGESEGDSGEYYGDGDSEGYYTQEKKATRKHPGGATSYYVRHY